MDNPGLLKTISALFFFLGPVIGYAQTHSSHKPQAHPAPATSAKKVFPEKKTIPELFTHPEKEAEFPGGENALIQYLIQNTLYPETARNNEVSGTVLVQFQVCANGKLCEARVINQSDSLLTQEALRVVRGMPNWTPAQQNGKKVNCLFTLPIRFELSDSE